jgi:nucleoside phosphorylase
MSSTPFKAGGALTDEHAPIYIERQADRDALTHLRAMDYLLVIEPRQQGKTSLINRLMCHPALGDMAFAYLDMTTPDCSAEATWYQTLCPRALRQLRGSIPRDQWPVIPQNSASWRDFLWDVAALATDAHQCVVIALDEIGAVTFPGATEFFSVLRDVYNSRQAETELKQITFLLVGAFHPRDLIKDDRISPFNIAQRVRLEDFTIEQVRELVSKGEWTDEQATWLAERIHYWTDGQPYLTQLLCSYLGPGATVVDVDTGVDRLRREDENHLPPLMDRLNSDEKLRRYVERILAGERIKFYPRENRRQAKLELLGVIKADTEGCCMIRNRIYVQALTQNGPSGKMPQVLLDFTSPQLIERDWGPYGSEERSVVYFTEYDTALGKRVLVKKGRGFDSALRHRPEGAPPLDWKFSHYELSVRLHSESVICVNVLDKSGKNRTLLYSSAILPGLNQWEEFHIPLDKFVSNGTWHSLVIDLPGHMTQARWSGFVNVNWISLRGEVALAGIRGCDDKDSLVEGVMSSPYVVHLAAVPALSQEPKPMSFPELVEALQHRTLVFFIGADLPREVAGLPSRADLACDLAHRKGLDETLSLAEVAQRVGQAGNRWEFTAFIRDALDITGKSPQPFHRRIVELVETHHIETVITTAYDNLLELAFQQAGVGINRVVQGSGVSFINPDRPTLIMLYGDAQQPDTLVVTDRDHSDLLRDRDREALVDEVRRAFRRNTVLFLGYNLADPDFRFLFDQIAESRFARTAYAVWPGLPEADVRMWRDRGIVILDADPLGGLDESILLAAPSDRPETTITVPASSSRGDDMNYERGLDSFKQLAQDTDWYQDYAVYESPLRENLSNERRYGPSEQTRRDRARLVDQLNALALKHLGISFTDLCLGKFPPLETQPTPNGYKSSDTSPGEQRADFAIITALEKEARAVVSRLEHHSVQRFEDRDIRTYHCGQVPIQDTDRAYRVVVVLLPSIGNVPAANAVTDTITRWQPRFVLMVGIAGGIPQNDLDLGDVVVADQIVGYEYGKVTEHGIKPRDRVYPASALMLDRVRNFWDDSWKEQINTPRPENAARAVPKLFIGPIASGNKVIASTEFRQQLTTHWPKLIGLEMEGEGVFAAAFDRPQIPAGLVIRGICDMADKRKSDEWHEYAANVAAAFAISFLKSGPVNPK